MKPLVVGVGFVLLVGSAGAQDRLPPEEAQRYAKACVEQLGSLSDAQIALEVDPDKACAVRGEGGGAMVVPDRKLSKDALAGAGQEVIPVGQIWVRKWTVVAGGKPVPADRLRVVTVNVDDKDRPMSLFLLGLRKKDGKDPELLVYARDSDPLLALPLKGVDFVQELPVLLDWQRGEKDVDSLTLTLLGKYQAVLPVTRQ